MRSFKVSRDVLMAVILTRCIDLSMASNLALVGMCTAMLNAAMPAIPIVGKCSRNEPRL